MCGTGLFSTTFIGFQCQIVWLGRNLLLADHQENHRFAEKAGEYRDVAKTRQPT
jgi:hypothetical protein